MDLTQLSCEDFLSRLASKAPAPGGGGAAALVGAAGVALGNMVGDLTTGKKKYAAVEEEILFHSGIGLFSDGKTPDHISKSDADRAGEGSGTSASRNRRLAG